MAIRPEDEYLNTIPADAAYPEGSAKTASSPTATDGTPLDVGWVNDLWGFLQKILKDSGITPSGSPDTVLASDYLDGLQALMGLKSGSIRTVSITGVVVPIDALISVTAPAANTVITLLAANDADARMVEIFRPYDDPETYSVTLLPSGGGTIGGQASIPLLPGEGYRCFPDGGTNYILRAS